MTTKTEEKTDKKETKEKRELVVPGEIIAKGDEVLPGDWTMKQGENIIATRLGMCDKSAKLIKILPISGVYMPRRGNVVIAEIRDYTMRGWITNINAPYDAFLNLSECPMFVRETEMAEVHALGDLIVAKIAKTGRGSIDLTIKGRGLGKIKDGIIMKVNPNRVPRIIGKEGSMIKQIKMASDTEITVGQNGLIWIKGKDTKSELFAKKAVEFVNENTTTDGLTDKVEEWLKKNKKGDKK